MKTRIIFNRWDAYGRSVGIQAEYVDGSQHILATVSQDTSLDDGSPRPATVNWPGIGSVPPGIARSAAAALEEAARVAEEMEKVETWERITPPRPGLRWNRPGMPELKISDGKAWVTTDGWVEDEKEVGHAEG